MLPSELPISEKARRIAGRAISMVEIATSMRETRERFAEAAIRAFLGAEEFELEHVVRMPTADDDYVLTKVDGPDLPAWAAGAVDTVEERLVGRRRPVAPSSTESGEG